MRFIRQRDDHSCGPVAIINALKWAGVPVTYRTHFRRIKRLCRTTQDWGTRREDMSKALARYGLALRYEVRSLVTLQEMEKHLLSGSALILEYWFREGEKYDGHYVFIYHNDDHGFMVVNDMTSGQAAQPRTRKELKFGSTG